MKDVIKILIHQQRMIEREMGEHLQDKNCGHPSIHPDTYYEKLALAWGSLDKCIQRLRGAERDTYLGDKTSH